MKRTTSQIMQEAAQEAWRENREVVEDCRFDWAEKVSGEMHLIEGRVEISSRPNNDSDLLTKKEQ